MTITSTFEFNGDTWTAEITAGRGTLTHAHTNRQWCVQSAITDQGLEGAVFGDVELAWLTGCWERTQLAASKGP